MSLAEFLKKNNIVKVGDDTPDWIDYTKAEIKNNTIVGSAIDYISHLVDSSGYNSFNPLLFEPEKEIDEFIKNNPDLKNNELFLEHKEKLLDRVKNHPIEKQEFKNELSSLAHRARVIKSYSRENPKLSFALNSLAGLVDMPVYIAIGMAIEASAPVAVVTAMSSAGRRALFGGLSGIANSYILDKLSTREVSNSEYALNAILGGITYSLIKPNYYFKDTAVRAFNRIVDYDKLAKAKTKEEADEIIEQGFKKLKQEDISFNNNDIDNIIATYQDEVKKGTFDSEVFNKLRFDLRHYVSNSPSKTFSLLSNSFFHDKSLFGNAINKITAQELKMNIEDELIGKLNNGLRELVFKIDKNFLNRYSNATDELSDILGTIQLRRTINEEYTDEEAINDLMIEISKKFKIEPTKVEQLAKDSLAFIKEYSEYTYDVLSRYGSDGFDGKTIKKTDRYFHIDYRDDIPHIITDLGGNKKDLQKLIFEAFKNKLEKDKSILELAKDIVYSKKNIDNLSKDQIEELIKKEEKNITKQLKKQAKEFTEYLWNRHNAYREEYNPILTLFIGNKYTKHRLDIDRTTKITLSNGNILNFEHLSNKNFLTNFIKYARKMSGETALSKVKIPITKNIHINTIKKALNDIINTEDFEIFENIDKLKEIESFKKIADKIGNEKAHELIMSALDYSIKNKSLKDFTKTKEYKEIANYNLKLNTLGIEETRKKIAEELHEKMLNGEITKGQLEDELTRFDNLIKIFKGIPINDNPHSMAHRGFKIVSNFNIFRLLGMTYIPMMAEFGRVIYTTTALNIFDRFHILKEIIKQASRGNLNDKIIQEMQLYMGIGRELHNIIGSRYFDESFNIVNKSGKIIDKLERGSEKLADITLVLGGIKPLTAVLETMIGYDTIIKFSRGIFNGLTKNQQKFLNELGISEEVSKAIYENMKKYSKIKNDKLVELNINKWDNNTRMLFINAVKRYTHTVIQKSYIGDKVGSILLSDKIFSETMFGKLALELKNYMITAYATQLGRVINRKDLYMFGYLVSSIVALTAGYIAKEYLINQNNKERLKKRLEPKRIAVEVFNAIPEANYLPLIADTIYNGITGNSLFYQSRMSKPVDSFIRSMPTIDLLNRVFSIPKNIYDTASGNIKQSDINNLFGLMPNYAIMKYLREKAKGKIKYEKKYHIK